MAQTLKYVVVQCTVKDIKLTIRRWLEDGKEEILMDNNFAKLAGFPSKKDFVSYLLKDVETEYKEGDNLWIVYNTETNKIESFCVQKQVETDR